MAIITTLITLCSLLVLQVKKIPAENNPYYQKNNTETCPYDSLLQSGPKCNPRPTIIELPHGPLLQNIIHKQLINQSICKKVKLAID